MGSTTQQEEMWQVLGLVQSGLPSRGFPDAILRLRCQTLGSIGTARIAYETRSDVAARVTHETISNAAAPREFMAGHRGGMATMCTVHGMVGEELLGVRERPVPGRRHRSAMVDVVRSCCQAHPMRIQSMLGEGPGVARSVGETDAARVAAQHVRPGTHVATNEPHTIGEAALGGGSPYAGQDPNRRNEQ